MIELLPARTPDAERPSRLGRWGCWAGAAWCAAFAVVHFAWAAGMQTGVPAGTADMSRRPVFLIYDLAAGVLFVAAAVGALLLADGRLETSWRQRAHTVMCWGALLALLRGAGGLVQDIIAASAGHRLGIGVIYDGWFAVVGLIFWFVAISSSTGPETAPAAGSQYAFEPIEVGDQRKRPALSSRRAR